MITSVILLAAGAPGVLSGCMPCVTGRAEEVPICSAWGAVTLTAPADFTTSRPPYVDFGQSCLSNEGYCTDTPFFSVSTYRDYSHPAADDVEVGVFVSGRDVQYSLPSPSVDVFAELPGGQPPLEVISGDLEVRTLDEGSFVTSFTIELATPAGTHITLSGEADITNCHYEEHCSY